MCKTAFGNIKITADQAKKLREMTQEQSKSKLWFRHRAGRVTASKFKAAAHTNATQPSPSLIKEICYPTSCFSNEAIAWGSENEPVARSRYFAIMYENHKHFSVLQSGLVVHPDFPYLCASPDGIVKCDCCCGSRVLEAKCPFCCKSRSLIEAS